MLHTRHPVRNQDNEVASFVYNTNFYAQLHWTKIKVLHVSVSKDGHQSSCRKTELKLLSVDAEKNQNQITSHPVRH